MRPQIVARCTIDVGAAQSSTMDLKGAEAVMLIMPPAWTAADITFKVGLVPEQLQDLFNNDGLQRVVKVAAGRNVQLSPSLIAGFRYIAIVASVTQAAARALTLVGMFRGK